MLMTSYNSKCLIFEIYEILIININKIFVNNLKKQLDLPIQPTIYFRLI